MCPFSISRLLYVLVVFWASPKTVLMQCIVLAARHLHTYVRPSARCLRQSPRTRCLGIFSRSHPACTQRANRYRLYFCRTRDECFASPTYMGIFQLVYASQAYHSMPTEATCIVLCLNSRQTARIPFSIFGRGLASFAVSCMLGPRIFFDAGVML